MKCTVPGPASAIAFEVRDLGFVTEIEHGGVNGDARFPEVLA